MILGLAYLLVRPFLVQRFGWNLPGFTDATPEPTREKSGAKTTANKKERASQNRPVEVPTVPDQSEPVIPDDQSVADQSSPSSSDVPQKEQAENESPEEEPRKSARLPNDRIAEKSRIQHPASRSPQDDPEPKTTPDSKRQAPLETSSSGTRKKPPANPTTDSSPRLQQPQLGVLREIEGGALESSAGLIYRQDRTGNRLDHVLLHSRDNPSKPVHGVYSGNRDEILAWIDEAYMIAQKRGPPQVVIEEQGDRTTITVILNRKIGYMGGENGAKRGHPPLKMIKLVLEDRDVITAYPTNN